MDELEDENEHPDDNTPATELKVVAYLMREYDFSQVKAENSVRNNPGIMNSGKLHGSFTYYVGDKIAEACGQ